MGRGLGFRGNGSSILTSSSLADDPSELIGVTESVIRVPQYYQAVTIGPPPTRKGKVFRVILPALNPRRRGRCWHWRTIARDDGSHYGGETRPGCRRNLPRHPDPDSQYSDRNGICHRPAQEALIATGVVLFVFILLINFSVALLKQEGEAMSSSQERFNQRLKSYARTPGSFIVMLLVVPSAVLTFTVLIFLIAYILIHGIPYIKPSLFL